VDADRAARAARAATLHAQRASLREIAAELSVSPETVRTYIREVRDAEEWADARARQARGDRMVVFLNELARRGVVALEGRPAGTNGNDDEGQEPQPYAQVIPALMKVVQEINRVEGNYAPTRVAVADDRKPPDATLAAALEREARAAEVADAEESRRELE
jgi:DNA-binding Lrp family transcriptional regulator